LKFNHNNCIIVNDDLSIVLGNCSNNNTTFYREGNNIKSQLYTDKCITLDANNGLVMSDCNEFDGTQIYFFNLYNN